MHDLAQNLDHNRDNIEVKNQLEYLKHYFNGPAGRIELFSLETIRDIHILFE